MASFKKVTGSGRKIEGGKLVTYRQDFAAHYTGGAFRHNADQINMDPQIPGYLNPNVQGTMELLANAITGTEKEAYVTIGDGYAQGKYNVATEGSLKAAFDAALLDPQLQQGGLILIKAGVYHSALTIEIPAGISVMGENTGTYIFSQTATLFKTLGGETPNERWGGQGAASGNQSFQHTVISNLLLGDNLDGAADGGTNALPKVSSFIEIEEASNVQISYVTFIGRFGFSGGVQIPSLLTDKAINFPGGAGTTSTLTYLTVDHCMFDTMINPISFLRTDLTSSTLKVSNCRARTNSRSTSPDEDGFVSINIGTSGNVTNCTHIGTNATSYFLEIASGVAGGTASVDVIGNTTNGKLIDALTTGVQGVWKGIESNNTANNVKNNAWFTIVGDGVNSFGDINGPNALRTLLFTNAAKELPTTLYLGIGTHSLAMTTSTGIDQVFNFVGIDKDGEKPVVELSFGVGSATDALGRRTLVVGSRLENIVFKSTDSIFKTLSIGQEFVALKGVSLVVNECEFIDSGLVCGTEGGETPSLLIENSFFTSEDSAIDTDLFVVASIDIDKITLRDLACYPSGAGDRMHFLGGVFDFGLLTDGYALDSGFGTIYDGYNDGYFGQPLGLPNLSPGVQSITLDNVSYLLGDIPVANAINSSFTINAAPPVTVVSAWMVFNPGAAVTINNCQFAGTIANIEVIDPTVLVDGVAIGWVGLNCLSATITNSGMVSTYQAWTNDSGDLRPAATLVATTYGATVVNDCIIEGAQPFMGIHSDTGLEDAFLTVTNNLFRCFWPHAEYDSLCFHAAWNTSDNNDRGAIQIQGNKFIHNGEFNGGNEFLLPSFFGDAEIPGAVIVEGENRTVNFCDNDVFALYRADVFGAYVPSEYYAVSLNAGLGEDIRSLVACGNSVEYQPNWNENLALSPFFVNGTRLTMNSNNSVFHPGMPDTSLASTFIMRYSLNNAHASLDGSPPSIQSNSFHLQSFPGELEWTHGINVLGVAGTLRGLCVNNAFIKDNKSTEEEFDTPPNTFDGFGYQWTIEPNVGAYYTKTSPTSIPYIYLENGGGKQELYGNSGDLRVRKDVGTTIILSNVTVPLQWNGGAGPTSFYITNNLDSFIPHSAKIRIVTLTITGTFTIAIGDLNIIFLGANAESLNFTNAVPIADGTTYNISALGAQTGLITVRGANSSGSYIIDCTEIDNGIDDEDLFIQLELFYTY